MEIHMIGHASLFIKTKDCRILMDPVLWDPFYEKNNEVCPKREVIHELLPEFDFLVISHKHLDHFDIRTLAHLPKTVDVLIPKDKLIENSLRQLGYSHIYPLKDFGEVRVGSTSLLTTRSEERVPEYGLIVADDSGVFWNQVDTIVSTKTISTVLSRYSQIDFMLATWQPMLEGCYQFNDSISFPYAGYNHFLYNISLIQPKAIAPGSNGFRYVNGSSWLNQLMFPVSRERFCEDVKNVCPELGENIFTLDPGDMMEFNRNEFHYLSQKCDYVKKVAENRDTIEFVPVKIGTELKDENPHNEDIELMKKGIEEEITINLLQFFKDNANEFIEHRKWKIIYQLEVTFPDGSQYWTFDFSEPEIKLTQGKNPLANFFTYITGSGFYGLLKGSLRWEYVMDGGYYRTFNKVYLATPFGITYPTPIGLIKRVIEDPLMVRVGILSQQRKSDRAIDLEIEKWGSPNDIPTESTNGHNSMVKIGDVLLKTKGLSLPWGSRAN